jgi:phosphatidylglycerophosphate synthase
VLRISLIHSGTDAAPPDQDLKRPSYRRLRETVRDQYRGTPRELAELAQPAARYFFRPASFVFTPLLIRLGFTANLATALSAILNALALLLLATGGYVEGALCLTIAGIVDYSDGNLARYHYSHSIFGKFIDGLGDCPAALQYAAIGFGLLNTSRTLAMSGFVTSFLAIFMMFLDMRYKAFEIEARLLSDPDDIVRVEKKATEQIANSFGKPAAWLFECWVLSAPLILLAASLLGMIDLYMNLALAAFGLYTPLRTVAVIRNAAKRMTVRDPRSMKIVQ